MKIAILGGTFNPVHLGHVMIAENAVSSHHLDKVWLIPCASPPHKGCSELLPGEHRLAMLRLAIHGNPRFGVSDIEIERGGVSYSVDTVSQMRASHPGDRIFLIVGSDNLPDIGKWRRFDELASLCEFLVIERPGCPLREPKIPSLRYSVFKGPTMEAASSDIRRMIREGKNVSPWLSPSVYDYIRTHHLYEKTS